MIEHEPFRSLDAEHEPAGPSILTLLLPHAINSIAAKISFFI
jgi:hypothetical protein